MAGTGRTGIWRTGVWVEPLGAESTFTVNASASAPFVGDFEIDGGFLLDATASVTFTGVSGFDGVFDASGTALTSFVGEFTAGAIEGTFAVFARADISEASSFEFGPPGGSVNVKGTVPKVNVKTKPGDVVTVNGVSGVACLDEAGRLVVVSSSGKVLCIIAPSGVVIP